jgi:hypothetical protein
MNSLKIYTKKLHLPKLALKVSVGSQSFTDQTLKVESPEVVANVPLMNGDH